MHRLQKDEDQLWTPECCDLELLYMVTVKHSASVNTQVHPKQQALH